MDNTVHILYLNNSESIYNPSIDYATQGSVGLDLKACFQENFIEIKPYQRIAIPTGIAIEIQKENVAAFVYSRSGLGAVKGLTVAQGVGVIDKDYRGEIIVYLLNTSQNTLCVEKGDRIAQLVFQPVLCLKPIPSKTLGMTIRNTKGFGHSGK